MVTKRYEKQRTVVEGVGVEMVSFTVMCPKMKKLISVPFNRLKMADVSIKYDPGVCKIEFGRWPTLYCMPQPKKKNFFAHAEYSFKCKCGKVHYFSVSREQER